MQVRRVPFCWFAAVKEMSQDEGSKRTGALPADGIQSGKQLQGVLAEELRDLARRLVVRRKADGRGVYDKRAKAELVAEAGRAERSISRLARQCGINANQLNRCAAPNFRSTSI